jgi:transcription elongation factor Elf1
VEELLAISIMSFLLYIIFGAVKLNQKINRRMEKPTRMLKKNQPCPFCHANDCTVNLTQNEMYFTRCLSCHAAGPIAISPEGARNAWNNWSGTEDI